MQKEYSVYRRNTTTRVLKKGERGLRSYVIHGHQQF